MNLFHFPNHLCIILGPNLCSLIQWLQQNLNQVKMSWISSHTFCSNIILDKDAFVWYAFVWSGLLRSRGLFWDKKNSPQTFPNILILLEDFHEYKKVPMIINVCLIVNMLLQNRNFYRKILNWSCLFDESSIIFIHTLFDFFHCHAIQIVYIMESTVSLRMLFPIFLSRWYTSSWAVCWCMRGLHKSIN